LLYYQLLLYYLDKQ